MKLGIAGISILATLAIAGCPKQADSPRSKAAIVVVDVARGVRIADHLCAERARETHDLALATKCATAYEHARKALLVTQDLIDAWADGSEGRLGCALSDAISGVREFGIDAPEIKVALDVAGSIVASYPCVGRE